MAEKRKTFSFEDTQSKDYSRMVDELVAYFSKTGPATSKKAVMRHIIEKEYKEKIEKQSKRQTA